MGSAQADGMLETVSAMTSKPTIMDFFNINTSQTKEYLLLSSLKCPFFPAG
jgi:hypothetical protein